MKKIISLAFILLFTMIPSYKVKAYNYVKPIIALQYSDISSYVNVDGYNILSSTVNTNICGNYEIVYQNEDDTFTRKVSIVSEESLCKSGLTLTTKQDIWYNNDSFIKAYDFDGVRCLLFCEEDKLHLKLNYQHDVYFNINDTFNHELMKFGDSYYFACSYYNELSTYDIYVAKINFDGTILSESFLTGNMVDVLNGMYIDDNLYLYGKTASNNGSFFHQSHGEDSFVISLDLNSLDEVYYYDLGLEKNDSLVGLFWKDKKVIVQTAFVNDVSTIKISYLDDQTVFRYINTFKLNDVIDFGCNDSSGYILNRMKNDNHDFENNVYKINLDLNYHLVDSHIDQLALPVELYVGKELTSVLFNASTKTSLDGNYYYLRNIYSDNFINNITSEYVSSDDFNFIKNTNTVVGGNTEYIHTLVRCNDLGTINLEYPNTVEHPNIIYNDESIRFENDSIIDFDINKFGTYNLAYTYDLNDDLLIIGKELNVLPYINVTSGECYDLGYILKFNGTAHLNDVLINSNFALNQEGVYLLTITGKNLEKLEIEFQIRKQKSTFEDFTIIEEEVTKEDEVSSSYESKANIKLTKNITEIKQDKSLVFALIPLSILLVETVVYMILRRKFIC